MNIVLARLRCSDPVNSHGTRSLACFAIRQARSESQRRKKETERDQRLEKIRQFTQIESQETHITQIYVLCEVFKSKQTKRKKTRKYTIGPGHSSFSPSSLIAQAPDFANPNIDVPDGLHRQKKTHLNAAWRGVEKVRRTWDRAHRTKST